MSTTAVVIQILFITIGMIIFGMILNYILGLRNKFISEMRKKALNIQERMRNAQLLGDYQLMLKTQQESIIFMKQVMKKQIIPMCIRCIIFIGIFIVLSIIYSDYASGILPFPFLIFGNGWVAIYIIFSITFSLGIFAVKRIYKKVTGKGTTSQNNLRELIGLISTTQSSEKPFRFSLNTQSQKEQNKTDILPRKDSWKERLEE
ncbi:MAG: EMC3/TMCO1 family protein [Promethearchaeota archaeon]